jgi:hypothetical protein
MLFFFRFFCRGAVLRGPRARVCCFFLDFSVEEPFYEALEVGMFFN